VQPHPDWIIPDWPAPPDVRAFVTTRAGGVSAAPYDSLNLGDRTDDDRAAVAANKARVRASLPADPRWLAQVHGASVVHADAVEGAVAADASWTRTRGVVCAIKIADCMPVLLCDSGGGAIGAAHAGWRGLSGGVVEATLVAMDVPPGRIVAYLGPAIGPTAFEVGEDVLDAFLTRDEGAAAAFAPLRPGKWLGDLFTLARRRLVAAGVTRIHGGTDCTVRDPRFFSHRRDRTTGRMAAFIWRDRAADPGDAGGAATPV
jgi:YfiH family protein